MDGNAIQEFNIITDPTQNLTESKLTELILKGNSNYNADQNLFFQEYNCTLQNQKGLSKRQIMYSKDGTLVKSKSEY